MTLTHPAGVDLTSRVDPYYGLQIYGVTDLKDLAADLAGRLTPAALAGALAKLAGAIGTDAESSELKAILTPLLSEDTPMLSDDEQSHEDWSRLCGKATD